jgi:FixJ family two-component response regulator
MSIASGARRRIATTTRPPDVTARLRTLSEREREVLHQVLDSKPTRQIAEQLRISVKTVEFHRARIREKMGVARLAQLFSLLLPAGDKD